MMIFSFYHFYCFICCNSINIKNFSSPVVKNLPCNAGDVGLIPSEGTKIPHASGQLSPLATNYRAHVPWTLCATTREEKTRAPQLERSARTTTKSPRTARKDTARLNKDPACLPQLKPDTAKNKFKKTKGFKIYFGSKALSIYSQSNVPKMSYELRLTSNFLV